jgi:hypothetical protein
LTAVSRTFADQNENAVWRIAVGFGVSADMQKFCQCEF